MRIKFIRTTVATLLTIGSVFPLIATGAEGTEEVLMGINITAKEIELHVASGGCTTKENFSVKVDKGSTGKLPYVLRVYRVKFDGCKAFLPDGVIVKFSKDELGLSGVFEISLKNKLGNTSQHR